MLSGACRSTRYERRLGEVEPVGGPVLFGRSIRRHPIMFVGLCGIAIAICGNASWSWVKTRCLPQMDSINASISLSRSAGLLA